MNFLCLIKIGQILLTDSQLELSSQHQIITCVIVEKYVYIFPVYVDN